MTYQSFEYGKLGHLSAYSRLHSLSTSLTSCNLLGSFHLATLVKGSVLLIVNWNLKLVTNRACHFMGEGADHLYHYFICLMIISPSFWPPLASDGAPFSMFWPCSDGLLFENVNNLS